MVPSGTFNQGTRPAVVADQVALQGIAASRAQHDAVAQETLEGQSEQPAPARLEGQAIRRRARQAPLQHHGASWLGGRVDHNRIKDRGQCSEGADDPIACGRQVEDDAVRGGAVRSAVGALDGLPQRAVVEGAQPVVDVVFPIHHEGSDLDGVLDLEGACVAGRAARAAKAALVGRQRAGGERDGVDGRATRQQGVGEGPASVVLQGTEHGREDLRRVHASIAGVGRATGVQAQQIVAPTIADRSGAVGVGVVGCVAGDQAVAVGEPSGLPRQAASGGGLIGRERDVLERCLTARVVDRPALGKAGVSAEGAVGQAEDRAGGVEDRATGASGLISRERDVLERRLTARVIDRPTLGKAGVSAEGAVGQAEDRAGGVEDRAAGAGGLVAYEAAVFDRKAGRIIDRRALPIVGDLLQG